MKVIACCIAKLENPYIKEWVNYHLNLGFSNVIIYDNNDQNSLEALEGELIDYISTEAVQVVDFKELRGAQLDAYDDCFNRCNFDWCAFIDCDEFIAFSEESGLSNINEYLSSIDPMYDIVHLNWLCHGDNGKIFKGKGPVQSRFSKPILPLNWQSVFFEEPHNNHIKSIIRKKADILWADCTPHTPTLIHAKICDGDGNEIIKNSPFSPATFKTAFIRHYATKSLQEFINQKIIRQAADRKSTTVYNLENFYFYNKKTVVKQFFAILILLYVSPSKWKSLLSTNLKNRIKNFF